MKEQFNKLGVPEGMIINNSIAKVMDEEIKRFQLENEVTMPNDLVNYFKLVNGSDGNYDERMFQFYSLDAFKDVCVELKDWRGVPDYGNIVNTLNDCESCFLIADYCFHLFMYAIRLYPNESSENEVYVICEDRYKIIANSFSKFVELYLEDSIELYFT